MALGAGSIVLQKITSTELAGTALGPAVVPQRPHFGVVISAGPPFTVLWDNGKKNANTGGVDDLYAVSANSLATFFGQVVRVASESAAYQYVVVAMYRRTSAASAESALLKTVDGRAYREVPVSQLAVVPGR